eukprot:2679780-Alexandrium_andersonii.AAC.1
MAGHPSLVVLRPRVRRPQLDLGVGPEADMRPVAADQRGRGALTPQHIRVRADRALGHRRHE